MENLGSVTTDGGLMMPKYLIGLDAARFDRTAGVDQGRPDRGFLVVRVGPRLTQPQGAG